MSNTFVTVLLLIGLVPVQGQDHRLQLYLSAADSLRPIPADSAHWSKEALVVSRKDALAIAAIRAYIKQIDTWDRPDFTGRRLAESIEEGPITQVTTIATLDGFTNRSDTVIQSTKKGGWDKYTLYVPGTDTLYRVYYYRNGDKSISVTWYYKDNRLVCARLDCLEEGGGNTFYKREEYYDQGKLLHREEPIGALNQSANEYKRNVDVDLYNQGNDYLRTFLKDHNR